MKNKVLAILKESERYVSGQELGEQLGVSRAAIWKTIKSLERDGYVIEAGTNKGYKLMESGDLLNETEVQQGLRTTFIGRKILVLESVDSTNNHLRTLAFEGAEEGQVVIADTQSGGKGRRGKAWTSPKGEGLWMSVLLKPPIEPNSAAGLTLVTGLSVCKGLRELGYDVSIKWPNDIILKQKKVCGILAEMSAQIGCVDFVIVGIGVNVNSQQMPEDIQEVAVSLKMATGETLKRSRVAGAILNCLERYYQKYVEKGFAGVKDEYEENCITLNKEVEVLGKVCFKGRAVGITDEGELIVERENGRKETVYSGEVSVRGVL